MTAAPEAPRGNIALDGELSIYTAAATKAQLVAALEQHADLVLDLGLVPEIDTAGVQLLLMAHFAAEQAGGRLTLARPAGCVLDALALCNLDALFRIDLSGATLLPN